MAIQVTIEDHFIPYLVLLFHVLVLHMVRCFSTRIVPENVYLIVNEVISTVELCACCAELGPVWELHGNVGLAGTLFLLCAWWCQAWGNAEACPCGAIEEFVIMRRSLTSPDLIQKLFGQIVGGWLTWKYTTLIWCWHFTEQHHHLHEVPCEASLYVSPLYGAIIEGLITFISRIIALESEQWNHLLATMANSLTTVVLVLFALNSTGGFFNPIMASALMIGCQGHTYWEHFQVYWLGSLLGSLLARWLHYHMMDSSLNKNKYD